MAAQDFKRDESGEPLCDWCGARVADFSRALGMLAICSPCDRDVFADTPEEVYMREAFRNQGATALKRAFC